MKPITEMTIARTMMLVIHNPRYPDCEPLSVQNINDKIDNKINNIHCKTKLFGLVTIQQDVNKHS